MQLGEKTAVIPIGGNYDINDKLCPELALSWEDKFTLLGFQIDNRLKHLNDNYEKCFKKVHEISRQWARYRPDETHNNLLHSPMTLTRGFFETLQIKISRSLK